MADTIEKIVEKIPSRAKIRNSVTSVLKVSNTHFKLHVFEMVDAVFRASITQWKGLGNILVTTCEATEACYVSDKKSWFCLEAERKEGTCCSLKKEEKNRLFWISQLPDTYYISKREAHISEYKSVKLQCLFGMPI